MEGDCDVCYGTGMQGPDEPCKSCSLGTDGGNR